MTGYEIYVQSDNLRRLVADLVMAGGFGNDAGPGDWRVSDNLGGHYYRVPLAAGRIRVLQNTGDVGSPDMAGFGAIVLVESDADNEARNVLEVLIRVLEGLGIEFELLE